MITLLFVRMRPSALLFTTFIELLFIAVFLSVSGVQKRKKNGFQNPLNRTKKLL